MEDINLGARVRQFRNMRGLSLRELAARAGTTPSMLSQMENNGVNPSINTLKSLAAALQVPLFKFFQDENKEEKVIVRKGKYKIIGRPEEEVVYQLLTPDVSGMIEFCSMTVPPGQVSSEREMEHAGEEVAYVMTGAVRIYMEGKEYELGEGDCVRIPPQCLHRWENHEEEEAKVIFAITPPSF